MFPADSWMTNIFSSSVSQMVFVTIYSPLPLWYQSSHKWYIDNWLWLRVNKTSIWEVGDNWWGCRFDPLAGVGWLLLHTCIDAFHLTFTYHFCWGLIFLAWLRGHVLQESSLMSNSGSHALSPWASNAPCTVTASGSPLSLHICLFTYLYTSLNCMPHRAGIKCVLLLYTQYLHLPGTQ